MLNSECRFASLLLGFIAHSHYDLSITIFYSFCFLWYSQVHFLYKGTLRVLLVLLHDFPEFLCDFHFTFCDVIPPSCIQMRNIILSAFPRNMRLPDPSTPNLKVPDWSNVILVKRFFKRKKSWMELVFFDMQIDLLAEIRQSPRILSDVETALKAKQIKADLDEYLKVSGFVSFIVCYQKICMGKLYFTWCGIYLPFLFSHLFFCAFPSYNILDISFL